MMSDRLSEWQKDMNIQVGGTHYSDMVIHPTTYIVLNKLGWREGHVIKYVSRWEKKGGVEDLRKAKDYLEQLIKVALDE